jgi:hydrogenase maturation factor
MTVMALRAGKIPIGLLEELLELRGVMDPSVRLGGAVGEDAAVIDLGEEYLVLKTDPVTFVEEEVGWYAVHINANDVATRGSKPRWFQATVLLPAGSDEALVRRVFHQVHDACLELGVALTGGHTEVTDAVNRVVIVGDMQGLVAKDRLVVTSGAREGDLLVLTKAAGIEGTAILARERSEELSEHLGADLCRRAMAFLRSPGLSVVREALLAAEVGATSLHDPTEGGVAMGLYELSAACARKVLVEPASIPVAEETRAICEFFGLNPLGLISSGALLVAIPESRGDRLLQAFSEAGIAASIIGQVGGSGTGIEVKGSEGPYPLEPSETDELTKAL